MAVGKSVQRVDGVAKVTGKARYADDFTMPGMRVARYLRSTIAHGRVLSIDTSFARALPGVDGVFTFEDVPGHLFATAGHPYSMDPAYADVEDRRLLTDHVRYMGDEIAIVVADNELTAARALSLIEVEYESYRPLVEPRDILADGAREIHTGTRNVIKTHSFVAGGDLEQVREECDHLLERDFRTQIMQHCHLENHTAHAYMDDNERIVVVSSTQIPHIARRIVAEAIGVDLGQVRVVKPYIGGGFGNKQDVILEPMVAFLTKELGGIPIRLRLDREEGMVGTRVRHPFDIKVEVGFNDDGTVRLINLDALSNTGAYASHGHSVVAAGVAKTHYMYPRAIYGCSAKTVYGNIPAAGAMRAYGSPQIAFAVESIMEEAAQTIGMDPVEFRLKNGARAGDMSRLSKKPIMTCGLLDSIEKGRRLIDWDRKRSDRSRSRTGPVRHGLGMAIFSYGSGTYPACLEAGSARLILNQDGSVNLQVGATEIGQGSDTVFAQMVAETTGVSVAKVHVISAQDTDVSPFDTGAYASRQTYVSGQAVMHTAEQLREKILAHASTITGLDAGIIAIANDNIVIAKTPHIAVMSVRDVALDAYYDKNRGGQITAEVSDKVRNNPHVFGCTFVDVTVDIPLCSVTINEIINVHDCGVVINPVGAEGQVHGGMAMGIGMALYEELMVDPDSGKIYNNNLLDYKVPTIMDIPDLGSAFVETHEPSHPYGAKSLGEPPVISPPPAIRNAILDATGVAINELPMTSKIIFKYFKRAGLL